MNIWGLRTRKRTCEPLDNRLKVQYNETVVRWQESSIAVLPAESGQKKTGSPREDSPEGKERRKMPRQEWKMAAKTDAEVIIDGKVYTLSGYESEEYLQKIASYLNGKIAEFRKNESYNKLNPDFKNILMQINVADDYFRTQREMDDLKADGSTREKDLYDLKHELIATQMKLEATEKNLKEVRAENDENAKKIIRLETELKTRQEHSGRS